MSDINKILALSGLAQNGIKQTDESKSQGDAWYKEQRAKEAYEKANPGKSWKDLPYGYKEDWRKKTESVESGEMVEAVGDSAEAFYQLQDEFAGSECPSHAHRALIDELIRYLSGDQVADFVADFRRHYDMNDTEESVEEADSELSVMANSRDRVESTYAEIIKGDAEQTEVGDYIGHGMTKDQILKLIDMLEPQGYDKDFLLKDLAPMMEAGGDKVDNSKLSRILKLSGLEVDEAQVNEYSITTRDERDFDQEDFNLAHAVDTLAQKLIAKAGKANDRRYDPQEEYYAASDYYGYPDVEELLMPEYGDLSKSDRKKFMANYAEPPVVNPDAIGESVQEGEAELAELKSALGRTGGVMGFKN